MTPHKYHTNSKQFGENLFFIKLFTFEAIELASYSASSKGSFYCSPLILNPLNWFALEFLWRWKIDKNKTKRIKTFLITSKFSTVSAHLITSLSKIHSLHHQFFKFHLQISYAWWFRVISINKSEKKDKNNQMAFSRALVIDSICCTRWTQ